MTLSDDQLDALAEVINIGAGRAAAALSDITGSRIELTVPHIRAYRVDAFHEQAKALGGDLDTLITQSFEGGISGRALLAFPRQSAVHLAHVVGDVQGDLDELDFDAQGVLEEVGNILLNAVLGSIANLLQCGLTYELPELRSETPAAELLGGPSSQDVRTIVVADTHFGVASRNIASSLILVFEIGSLDTLLGELVTTRSA